MKNSLKSMNKYIFSIKILIFLTLAITLNSCQALKYKPTKAGEVPVSAKDRVKKNISKAIKYYKEADLKNNMFARNRLKSLMPNYSKPNKV